jgi:polynucleotide 5'-kinase involved in rRNA processing
MADFIEKGDTFVLESTKEEGEEGATATPQGVFAPRSTRSGPVVVLVIGMAGSGKTTLMHRINHHMKESGKKGYYINLDPGEIRYK